MMKGKDRQVQKGNHMFLQLEKSIFSYNKTIKKLEQEGSRFIYNQAETPFEIKRFQKKKLQAEKDSELLYLDTREIIQTHVPKKDECSQNPLTQIYL